MRKSRIERKHMPVGCLPLCSPGSGVGSARPAQCYCPLLGGSLNYTWTTASPLHMHRRKHNRFQTVLLFSKYHMKGKNNPKKTRDNEVISDPRCFILHQIVFVLV